MDDAQLTLLKQHLAEEYAGNLPPLLIPSPDAAQNEQKNLARSLSAFFVHHHCGASVEDACLSVVDDFGDLGIDAIYYQADIKTLFLIQSKLKASQQFTQEEANSFVQGIRKLIVSDYTGFNQNVLDRQAEIDIALDDCEHIQLVVAHAGAQLGQYPNQALLDMIADQAHGEERFKTPVVDFAEVEVIAALREVNAHQQIDCTITLFDWAKLAGNRTAYIGMVKLEQLASLHQQYGRALYARNIRASLGHQTAVNQAIDASLQGSAADFEFFNNGVTALCGSVEGRAGSRERKNFKVKKMSIVNGAQTVATAARRMTASGLASISDARVLVTVIAADTDNAFGQMVTQARNYQNDVAKVDFIALDQEQERIRRELALLGYRYSYQAEALDLTDQSTIRAEEAAFALAMLLPDPRLPVMAKRNAASLYKVGSYPYSDIFVPALTAFELRNAVLAYRYIATRMHEEAAGAGSDQERLTYRHGSYALAFVLMKRVRNALAATPALEPQKLVASVGPEFDRLRQLLWSQTQPVAVGRSPMNIFKTQADVSGIIRSMMTEHYGLQTNPALPALIAQPIGNDAYPVNLFRYLSTQAPQIGNLS